MTFVPMLCPKMPTKGLQRMKSKFEACPNPDVCKQRGCLLEIRDFAQAQKYGPDRVNCELNRDEYARSVRMTKVLSDAAPVDRSQRTLTDGLPVTDDHRELKENGQQKGYVVLSAAERAKGFVRPVRRSYIHTPCGTTTTMSQEIAETYARDPSFYSGTFCVGCRAHKPLTEFVWADNPDQQVGS